MNLHEGTDGALGWSVDCWRVASRENQANLTSGWQVACGKDLISLAPLVTDWHSTSLIY